MKKFDKVSKVLYTITYGAAILIMFFVWLFLMQNIFSNKGFSRFIMIIFSIGMLLAIYSNACQLVKLYNEEAGKKMFKLFSTMYYIVFIINCYFAIFYAVSCSSLVSSLIFIMKISIILLIVGLIKKIIDCVSEKYYKMIIVEV